MAKFYLLGGENTIRKSAKEINKSAFLDAGVSPAFLVFPWARASFDDNYLRRRRLSKYFQSLGARSVDFVDFSEPTSMIAERMANTELVYLTGGQMIILLARLKQTGVDKLLTKYDGLIIGRSAGALALAKYGIVTNRYSKQVKAAPGLGLTDLCIKTHYEPSKDGFLENFSQRQSIFAIPSHSAIIVDKGNLSFLGEVYLFEKGEKHKCATNQLM